jgi:hypothetical protein
MLSHQLAAQDLSNGGLGQFTTEFDVGGHFVRREAFLAERLEFLFGHRFAGLDHHPGFDRLTAIRVGDAATPTSNTLG